MNRIPLLRSRGSLRASLATASAVLSLVAVVAGCGDDRRPKGPGPGTTPADDTDLPTDDSDPSPDDTDAPTDTAITGVDVVAVQVTPSPQMALLMKLDVVTAAPAAVRVRCGSAAVPTEDHRLHSPGPATEHVLVLDGLLADHAYDCTATTPGGTPWPFEVRTGPLPEFSPVVTATTSQGGVVFGAYTIFTHTSSDSPPKIYIVDAEGRIRWYFLERSERGGSTTYQVGIFAPGVLFIGGSRDMYPRYRNLDLTLAWMGPPSTTGGMYHHDARRNDRDEVVTLSESKNTDGEREWEGFHLDVFQAYTDELLWSLDSQQLYEAGDLPPSRGRHDPYHANGVSWVEDEQGEGLLLSLAALDRIVRLEPYTGRVLWQLGRDGDYTLLDDEGNPITDPTRWFYFQHDPTYDGTHIVIHDNGMGRDDTELYSRGLRLRLDKDARTATIDWIYREEGWYEPLFGGTQMLANGHVLLAMGHSYKEHIDRRGAILQIDPATNEVVHRLELSRVDDNMYRGERIDGCDAFHNAAYCPKLAE